MKKLLVGLCTVGLLASSLAQAEEHEWTNKQGKTYVVKLADLTPQSRALAAKLRVQKSTSQEPVTKAEAPKVVVDSDQLERRDGLRYFKGKPFTGVAVYKYENGKKKREATFKDGDYDGLYTVWYENGQKELEKTYKDGLEDGLWTWYYENGQKKEESTYKDGMPISRRKYWDKDGNPE
jgi:antitoxin component YwqK of YwqJK toxin-antitoxin module